MEKVFIGYDSAFEFYRNARANMYVDIGGQEPSRNSLILKYTSAQPKEKDFKSNELKFFDLPYCGDNKIDLCVKGIKPEYRLKNINLHCSNINLPYASFLKYAPGICISSPQLLFLQLAQSNDFAKLMKMGLELCGSYSINEYSPDGFISRLTPILDSKKLQTYLKRLQKLHPRYPYINKAIEAAYFLANDIASPSEAELYIKLCAPRKYGGYALKGFSANTNIKLSEKAANMYGRSFIKPDLANVKTKIAIEYDSNAFHNNSNQNIFDKTRLDVFSYEG